ncbi:hypothetical protein FA15DRAFT_676472 [Coprinopsis marcescibilis]|uniref:TPR-like protein n=1 Tax=Coprinopsis marcescibilis TaxID=230819 RepID=A0A5C3KAA7_COPMA|nr:hypothetical protein FA15DRAFT_676472 [Coprinopsis marcescibilis]
MPSLTPPLTFQEMRQVRIQWCMLSYKHRCADVTLCLHHTAHLAAQSGAVDIPIMCFLLDIRNRCAPNVLLPKLTVGHLFRLLSILVDAQSCPTVAIAVLKELESRQLHPDEVRKHVLRSAALRSILNLPADSLQGESRGPSEDDLSRALQSTNLASGEEKTIKEPGKPLSISVQPNPPVTQPNPIADVKLSPLGDAGLPALLNNVGSSFKSPFEQTGNPSDIDEVIASLERAVELTPPGHAGLPAVLNNLGSSFKSRFERTGNPSDIDEAIASLERAVKLTPPDHADLPGRLNNLGFSFKSRFERTGNPSDSDEAIASLERAVELTPPGHVDLPAFLRNLESSLRHLE